jgi:hypothetical protein
MSEKPYPTHYAGDEGWSDWVQPIMDGYRLACCDCGLVHEMQFEIDPEDSSRVLFRARRHNRATGQIRRHHAPHAKRILKQLSDPTVTAVTFHREPAE